VPPFRAATERHRVRADGAFPCRTAGDDGEAARADGPGGLAGWRAGGLAGWRAGGLAGWRAGGLAMIRNRLTVAKRYRPALATDMCLGRGRVTRREMSRGAGAAG